jgi:hypothetical protein
LVLLSQSAFQQLRTVVSLPSSSVLDAPATSTRKVSPMSHVRFAIIIGWIFWSVAVSGQVSELNRGDHIDVAVSDGRTLTNVELLQSNAESIVVRDRDTLTSIKLADIVSVKKDGRADVLRAAPPQPEAEPASPPDETSVAPMGSAAPSHAITESNPVPSRAQSSGPPILLWFAVIAAISAYAYKQAHSNARLKVICVRYEGIVDLDKVMEERRAEIESAIASIKVRHAEREQVATEILRLRKELSLFENEQELVACGHYRPTFDFSTSDAFKAEIDGTREQQRSLIKNDAAARCDQKWTVNGSESEGRKATKRTLKLLLRAFNGESDAIIARVSWNNIDRMLTRLDSVFEAINKLGASYNCALTLEYLMLKQKELKLTFEYENKVQQEKEGQRALREQMRDEERARREIEEMLKQTALDEERSRKALEQARIELATASGRKETVLQDKILLLEGRLAEALRNKERAISRAQLTKSGHVYIISNIGSFGETMFKIGMTRRLEPLDRVQELSDASVPFSFDIHALIYTDDAPSLEYNLHRRFDRQRVNLVNERKEFFHTTIDQLELAVKECGATITLTKLAEARDYRMTLERRKAFEQLVTNNA